MKISSTGKVFLACLLINFFCSAGHNDSVDAGASIDTAAALVERFSFRVERSEQVLYFARGRDGGDYTKLGLVHPFLYVPAVVAGKALANTKTDEKRWTDFFVSLTNPLFHAMLVALLFFSFTRSGVTNRRALLFSLGTGYATLLFPYAKTCHREIFQALLFTAAFVMASRPGGVDRKSAWGCGIFATLIFLGKMGLILSVLPILFYAASQSIDRSWRRFIPLLLPLVLGGLVWVIYWKGIVGTESVTGYGPQIARTGKNSAWPTAFWWGMFIQFFQYQRGLFWLSPVVAVAAAIWIIKAFKKQLDTLDIVVILTIVVHAAVHAKWFDPTGRGPLGPRYLLAVIPLLAFSLRGLPTLALGRMWAAFALILLIWSSIYQAAFILIKPQMYVTIRQMGAPVPWRSYEAPWTATFRIIGHKLRGEPEVYSTAMFNPTRPAVDCDLRPHASYAGFNFWWAHWWRNRQ